MTNQLLSSKQRQLLESMVKGEEKDILRRRAQIILLYDDGQPTRLIAVAVGRSRGRACYWRRQFRIKGMNIFPNPTQEPQETPAEGQQPAAEVIQQPAESTQNTVPPGESTQTSELPTYDDLKDFLEQLKEMDRSGMEPADTLAEAGRKIMRYQFAEMLRHESGTRSGEDIEDLHDMRVATRRMRASFEVFGDAFKPKALKSHLKGLKLTGRKLGRARDMDVLVEKAEKYRETLPEDQRPGLQPLLDAWNQDREAARTELEEYLDSKEYRTFRKKFFNFVNQPGAGACNFDADQPVPNRVYENAPVLIYTRLAAVWAYSPLLPNASIEQLHALRIEFKQLRYAVEFFREVLGDEAKPVINNLKGMQDHLGDLHDAQVATELLNNFLSNWDTSQSNLPVGERLNPEPVVSYLAYQYAERYRLMTTFKDAWAKFARPEFKRNLALAISVL